jgi:hypothetical protein
MNKQRSLPAILWETERNIIKRSSVATEKEINKKTSVRVRRQIWRDYLNWGGKNVRVERRRRKLRAQSLCHKASKRASLTELGCETFSETNL